MFGAVQYERGVSLHGVVLKPGERIESIEVTVSGAVFRSVQIPLDWSFDIGSPISGISTLKGEAGHGTAMPFDIASFQHFLSLGFGEYAVADDHFLDQGEARPVYSRRFWWRNRARHRLA